MPNLPDPFAFFTPKRMLRINLFVWKWLMRLLSASVEVYLRRNFGRRYLLRLCGAVFFCTVCASLVRRPSPLTGVFVLVLFVLIAFHAVQVCTRRSQGVAEPHSFSTGDSWPVWRRLPCAETVVQRYLEPCLCVLAGLILGSLDPFLEAWLAGAGIALFMKGQISRMKDARRVLDALDARHEAQALHAALNARQQPRAHQAQQPHRARLPGFPPQRHP